MADEVKVAPAPEESKQQETAKVEADAKVETKVETKAEDTNVGDILGLKESKKETKMVPEAVLLEYKKDNKELKADIKELKRLIEDGASKKEVSQELKDIAEEHNIDPEFLDKLAKSIKAQTKAEMESEISSKMKPLEEKERLSKIDAVFNEHFEKTLLANPEYKDIANKEVIKALSLNPENSRKTFKDILDEAYGHLIKGKKTLETTKSRETQTTDVDIERAKKDSEYFREVMSDPELKKKYNDGLIKRLQSHL